MAFALVDPETQEPIKDLSKFAKLEAYQTSFNASTFQEKERLGTHPCTQQDLKDRFENIEDYVEKYWEGYRCLDHPEDIVFRGEITLSLILKNLALFLGVCTDDCAEESQLDEFWQNNYALVIALTAQEYDENEYGNGPVKSKPYLNGDIVRRPKDPQTNFKILTMQENFLESDDKLISLGFF